MFNHTILSESDKEAAEALACTILNVGLHDQVAAICCYGHFLQDMPVMEDQVRAMLVTKAARAIEVLGGPLYAEAVFAFQCDMEKREAFEDYVATRCFERKLVVLRGVENVQ